MTYGELWKELHNVGIDDLERAAAFYEGSPDGQHDKAARLALLAVIEQMRRDRRDRRA